MRNKNILVLLVSILFLTSTVSAVSVSLTASPNSFSLTAGQVSNTNLSYVIDNSNNPSGSYGVSLNGQFISYSGGSISFNANATTTGSILIPISIPNNTASGSYTSSITLGGETVTLNFVVSQPVVSQIIVFPTNKVLTIEQETETTQNILITVPSSYPRIVTIQSTDFNPGTPVIKFGNLNLGQITPGQTLSIPIVFSGKNAQVGTYQTGLNIFATDSQGQVFIPSISLTLQVSSGVNPITNTTFSNPPSCILSSNNLNLNGTYTFTCQNVYNNIDINVPYNPLIEGISVNKAGSLYTYTFKATKIGVNSFIASFSYQGSTLFNPFNQEIRVSNFGSSSGGNVLKVVFTPQLEIAKSGEKVIIQIINNQTGSLVENPELYVNAQPLEKNGYSFNYSFETSLNYSIRARSPGFEDLVTSVSLSNKPLNISFNPSVGNSATLFNILESNNATLFIDNSKVSNPYVGTLSGGTHEIKAIKEGFLDSIINFTVETSLTAIPSGEFKKGTPQVISLNHAVNWTVYYQKDISSGKELLLNGNGSTVEFTPGKSGIYTIESNNTIAGTFEAKGWSGKLLGLSWIWWVVIVIICLTGYYFISGKSSSDNVQIAYSGSLNR